MKHGYMNKLTALLLAAVLLCGLPLGAAAETPTVYPVIFLPEMTEIVLYQNPDTLSEREVFNPGGSDAREHATNIVAGLLAANVDVDDGAEQISKEIGEIFDEIQCDADGNSQNRNLGPRTYNSPVAYNTDEPIYTKTVAAFTTATQGVLSSKEIFVFEYDWRMDPAENAKLLADFIKGVKINTGKKKVSLVAGGYGGVVANAYMYYYPEQAAAELASCVFADSLTTGSSLIGDLMSGDLIRSVSDAVEDMDSIFDIQDVYDNMRGADVGEALERYLKADPTGIINGVFSRFVGSNAYSKLITALSISLASFILEEQGLYARMGSGYREILSEADDAIYGAGLREYLRNVPGLWAIVPEDSYEAAFYFLYGRDADVSDAMMEKIAHGRDVMAATERTLKNAQKSGVNVCVTAGYNLQILPITSSLLEQSDGLQATRYAAFGATTADMKHNLKEAQRCDNGGHNHLAPGKEVDASTCYLPENTWLLKNHEHMDYSSGGAVIFLAWLTLSDSQRTVWQNEAFPQYLQESKIGSKVKAISDAAEGDGNKYMYGDLNVDGTIDAADARLALRYAVGLEGAPTRVTTLIGDVDANGKIDAADARTILRYAVGLETGFSVQTR